MISTDHPLFELGQAASQVLNTARRMAMRGDSRAMLESYLAECRRCFLQAAEDSQRFAYVEVVEDMARALRHAGPNSEILGALVVLVTLSNQEGLTNFRCFSLSAAQRVRAEARDHIRFGVCDPDEIRLGAEFAISSLQPMAAA